MHNVTGITKYFKITMSLVIFFLRPAPDIDNREDGNGPTMPVNRSNNILGFFFG